MCRIAARDGVVPAAHLPVDDQGGHRDLRLHDAVEVSHPLQAVNLAESLCGYFGTVRQFAHRGLPSPTTWMCNMVLSLTP